MHITRLQSNADGSGGVPFDEPMLAVVGMWRQSELGRPDLALAIGETMIRIGQRRIAWSAYERGAKVAARSSPDPILQARFIDHCRRRQGELAESMSLDEAGVAELRTRFEAELQYGESFQQAYQEYEAEHIAKGKAVFDPEFYRDFYADREPIATPSGAEERTSRLSSARISHYRVQRLFAWGVAGAGCGAMVAAILIRIRAARAKGRPAIQTLGSSR